MGEQLQRGRRACRLRHWADARAALVAADAEESLGADDLERLAVAAHLGGDDGTSVGAWTRAHHARLREGDEAGAARCAIWLGLGLLLGGDEAQGSGWLARARRLIDEFGGDCVERGLLLVPLGLGQLASGQAAVALETFGEADEIGRRFRDADVTTFGRLGRGQALIATGATGDGAALLDEAMVAVTAGEVSDMVAGIVYCAVIEECRDIGDPRRAQQWTTALDRWCSSQPGLVAYRGQCLVHRAELLQLHGDWAEAGNEVLLACDRLAGRPAEGAGQYQRAELHRLRGELDQADAAYRQASRGGREPQPGLALLWLAQGRVGAAQSAIRRVAGETQVGMSRCQVLAALVEISLAAGDLETARSAAAELGRKGSALDTPFLHAMAAHARGSVLLSEGEARGAGKMLRQAWAHWTEVPAPYEAARARILIGLACRALGDQETAAMELDAARSVLAQLGAGPELARVEALLVAADDRHPAGLTGREVEILVLVATGKANRDVAAELVISEHTVARHLQNIFVKIDVGSRTAASAFAHEHRLL